MTWAVVLGGSSGLGLASARRLAADGFKLCLVYREPRVRQPELLEILNELRAGAPALLHFNADALSEAGRASVLDALEVELVPGERVSVVLHSIAKGALKPLASPELPTAGPGYEATAPGERETNADGARPGGQSGKTLTSRDVQLTIDAMATSLLDWVNAIRERRLFASDARVLAFTSEGARRVWPGYGAVSAAKASLESLVRSIAVELGPLGIRANCIQAGVTETRALNLIPGSDQLKRHALARNPLGRLTTPEDVAAAVSLLCKPEAAWINGTTLCVDGGEHLC